MHTGPRRSGKTALARGLLPEESRHYFDLEDPVALTRLDEPRPALDPLRGLVVIDELQRRPDLFPVLRVLVDRQRNPARSLILGSASGGRLRQSSESLAGRTERDSLARRKQVVQTLLERDPPQWGVRVPATALLRSWTMLAHDHGRVWSATEPAKTLGVDPSTIRRHLDLLTDALVVRQLRPWHANRKQRQIESPEVFVRDSGLLHPLLGIDTEQALLSHPKDGASWEGFVVEQILAGEPHDEAWFRATHQGAEIDLLLRRGRYTSNPGAVPPMPRSYFQWSRS